MLENVLHHHAVIWILLHDAQDEALCLLGHVHVLWELHLVLDLDSGRGTMRLRSSYE